jgi:starch synthase
MGPLAKAGGLGDVIRALPRALKTAGADPLIILPGYKSLLDQLETEVIGGKTELILGSDRESYQVRRARQPDGVPLYLIDHPGVFARSGIYGENGADYPDNHRRYIFFGRAAATLAASLAPDVLHTHDWHAAAAAIVARADSSLRTSLDGTASAFTIHNLAFQGNLDNDSFPLLGIDQSWNSLEYLEFYGRINLMKGAILLADGVSTVSPTYADEAAHDPEYGFGLEGVLRNCRDRFIGILNGADYDEWDPERDENIAVPYSPRRRVGKKACLYALRQELGLPHRLTVPVLGMVTRMSPQKGIDLLAEAIDQLLALDLQLVMLASGDPDLEQIFRQAQARHPGRLRLIDRFDQALAHRIQAGADMFLMPSRFEPCGLTQMYALKYGTVPIVRATGGLKDTVIEFDPVSARGNGFVFADYSPPALLGAVERALGIFHDPPRWARLMDNCFAADFSWARTAAEYLRWFERLCDARRAG